MSRIPAVKKWRVKTVAGDLEYVLAPTKKLAELNFRHDNTWKRAGFLAPTIASISVVRRGEEY